MKRDGEDGHLQHSRSTWPSARRIVGSACIVLLWAVLIGSGVSAQSRPMPALPATSAPPAPAASTAKPARTFPARPAASTSVGVSTVPTPAGTSATAEPAPRETIGTPPPSLDDIEHRTFEYFWQTANPENGLVPDHWPRRAGKSYYSSISAVGFALTAYPIGVERGWITRAQARARVLLTLKFFANAPQGASTRGDSGFHGFFYHFLNFHTGLRAAKWVEISTVDTTWLMAGVLFDESYFDQDNPEEKRIRKLAEELYDNVDWTWAQVRPPLISTGWWPERGFNPHDWKGYDEAMMLYILALGSPTHAIEPDAWMAWTSTYHLTWGTFMGGKPHIGFAPLFGHQYTQSWLDLRDVQDAFMREHGLTYFENSRRAVIGQQQYAVSAGGRFPGYGKGIWGLTACDGPGNTVVEHKGGISTVFHGYFARGADVGRIIDDGTIAPTAAIASIVFAPQLVLQTIRTMYGHYGKWLYGRYGFVDAFNPTFRLTDVPLRSGYVVPGEGWFDNQYLGIDEGPILLMIENHRSGFVWNVMRRNPHVRRGLERAGFEGGWLESKPHATSFAGVPATASTQ